MRKGVCSFKRGLFPAALLLLLLSGIAQADPLTFTFTLIPPDGAISGAPGSTVGWGYEIRNEDTENWLVTTALAAGVFSQSTPTVLFDFPILAPEAVWTVPYDGIAGLFSLTIDAGAPLGFVESGLFQLSAEFWDGDPLDPFSGASLLGVGEDVTAAYSVTVERPALVPEPATVVLFLSGLAGLGSIRRIASYSRRSRK
jgi:hypothetical protein